MRDLDELLTAAAPQVAPRTPELQRALDDLVVTAEAQARPQPRLPRRRLGIAALVAVGLIGAGAAAHAAGILLPRHPEGGWEAHPVAKTLDVTLPNGETCQATYMISPRETEAYQHNQQEWDDMWAAATTYLATVDAFSLDKEEYRDRLRREGQVARKRLVQAVGPDEVGPPPTEADVIVGAPGAELMERLQEELVRQGFPTDMLVMGSSNDCDPEAFE